jgi:ComF family protein
VRTIISARLKQWFAPSCVLCDAVSDDEISLCTGCQQDLPWILHACNHCGIPIENSQQTVCLACELNPPAVDSVICALHYAAPVDFLIKRMKFGHQLAYAKVLGVLLSRHLSQLSVDMPDALLPVPLHKARLRKRGFNQTLELYRAVNQQYPIGLFNDVKRIKNTKHSTMVKGDERKENLQGAFEVKAEASVPRHVVILDDVITTGATTNTMAKLLKEAGAETVSVWAVARATAKE